MQRLASSSDRHLVRFIGWAVEPRTLVRAAGLRDPAILVRLGWPAERVRALDAVAQAGRGQPGGGLPGPGLPHLREVERRLTRWLLATHQGAVSSGLLDWYLDEFTFRFNRRSARHRGLLFYRLLEEALVTPPQPYGTVVGGSEQIGRTARRSRVR
jgi:hypothetical protein